MTSPASPSAPILWPVAFAVTYLDGKTETLQLQRLSVTKLYEFTHNLADNRVPQLVCLATGKPANWIDSLTDESFAALAGQLISLNFPRAMTLMEKDPVIASKLRPIVLQFAETIHEAKKLLHSLGPTSSDSSPVPSPSASAVETPPASAT